MPAASSTTAESRERHGVGCALCLTFPPSVGRFSFDTPHRRADNRRMSDTRDSNTTIIAKALEPRMQRDKKLLHELYAAFDANRKAMLTQADAEQLSEAIRQEQKLFDTIVGGRKRSAAPDLVGPAARRAIRDQLARVVPAARKMARLNAANIAQLHGVLQHHGGATFDPDVVVLPEAAIDVSFDFDQFEAPYHFSEVQTPEDPDLDFDGSYAVHRWGIFGNDIELSHSHGHGDILSGASNKLAFTFAGVGLNYTVPASGRLHVTLVIRSLSSDVRFDMEERFGSTDGLITLENTFFVRVSGAPSGHLHSATVFDESRRFTGSDISGQLVVLEQAQQFIVTFTTDATFAQNESVAIMVASFVRAFSHAFLIRNRISATLNWHLEKVFVRVV
jgi:hypothetical protein